MKHQFLVFATVFIVIFFAVLSIPMPRNSTGVTGEAVSHDAETLDSAVANYFGVSSLQFPFGDCGDAARGLYDAIAYTGSDAFGGLSAPDRIRRDFSTGTIVGTLDLARSDGSGIISVTESVDSSQPISSFALYGTLDGNFVVDHGTFSLPSIDCTFFSNRGKAICDCHAH